MIVAVPKKAITGRQLRYAPFPAGNLRPWAEMLRSFADEIEETATLAEKASVAEIEIDGGTMFAKHIDLLSKAIDRTVAYVRGQARRRGIKP